MLNFFEMLELFVANNFGSKKGLMNYLIAQVKLYLGAYGKFQSVDFEKVNRFVFVCHGNICRSAFADVVAHQLGVVSVSCGMHAASSLPADDRAIRYANENGYDLSGHVSKNVESIRFSPDDLVVVMEPKHLSMMSGYLGESQVTLLGVWARLPHAYIHDPYCTPPIYFEKCMAEIVSSVTTLVSEYRAKTAR